MRDHQRRRYHHFLRRHSGRATEPRGDGPRPRVLVAVRANGAVEREQVGDPQLRAQLHERYAAWLEVELAAAEAMARNKERKRPWKGNVVPTAV